MLATAQPATFATSKPFSLTASTPFRLQCASSSPPCPTIASAARRCRPTNTAGNATSPDQSPRRAHSEAVSAARRVGRSPTPCSHDQKRSRRRKSEPTHRNPAIGTRSLPTAARGGGTSDPPLHCFQFSSNACLCASPLASPAEEPPRAPPTIAPPREAAAHATGAALAARRRLRRPERLPSEPPRGRTKRVPSAAPACRRPPRPRRHPSSGAAPGAPHAKEPSFPPQREPKS